MEYHCLNNTGKSSISSIAMVRFPSEYERPWVYPQLNSHIEMNIHRFPQQNAPEIADVRVVGPMISGEFRNIFLAPSSEPGSGPASPTSVLSAWKVSKLGHGVSLKMHGMYHDVSLSCIFWFFWERLKNAPLFLELCDVYLASWWR